MKEIEVKARLRDRQAIEQKLKELGCTIDESVTQIDTLYTKIVGPLSEYLKNDHFARIREQGDGKSYFTVKIPKRGGALVKTEHETLVQNPKEMAEALLCMGYKIAVQRKKERSHVKYKDLEICLDEVSGLGSFIEIEKITEENPDAVLKELKDVLVSLGVSMEDEVTKGYDILQIEKEYPEQ